MEDTKTMTTEQPTKYYLLDFLFVEQSLLNILSFAALASKFRISINTELDPSIKIHLNDGTRIVFKK